VIPFEEDIGTENYAGTPRLREVSPTGKVPVLHHGDLVIPDSLAILEYLAESPRRKDVSETALRDVERIDRIWSEALEASGGPFLFGGRFCNADAMYAPIVNRLHAYDLPRSSAAQAYMDAVMDLPAWKEWEREALAEPWTIAAYENL